MYLRHHLHQCAEELRASLTEEANQATAAFSKLVPLVKATMAPHRQLVAATGHHRHHSTEVSRHPLHISPLRHLINPRQLTEGATTVEEAVAGMVAVVAAMVAATADALQCDEVASRRSTNLTMISVMYLYCIVVAISCRK